MRPTDGPDLTSGLGDISDRADLMALLRDFYGRAFRDGLLGPVFVEIAQMDLEAHLPVMCDFWESALFRAGRYRRNALHPHQLLHTKAHLTPEHFHRWLALWQATVTDRHAGAKAELAKVQGSRIAGAMCRRLTGPALAEQEPIRR
jgi:hemoglobin